MSNEDIQKTWNDIAKAWHFHAPPARPSEGHIKHYEQLLLHEKTQGNNNCLLLGATPEIRSLIHKHECKVVCVDHNRTMFDALRKLVNPNGPEHFLCSDWLEMNINPPVEIVMGDASLNMLPHDKHEELLKLISNILCSNGAAILRINVIGNPQFSSPVEVFDWYRTNLRHKPVFTTVQPHLVMLWLRSMKTQVFDHAEYYQYICELYTDGVILETEFSSFKNILQQSKIKICYSDTKTFERLTCRDFTIEKILYADDFPGHIYYPIYRLRKIPS